MSAANVPEYRPVYRSLHRALTVCGVDRRLFFLALLVGAATFNLFYSFLAGCLLFSVIYAFAWVSTSATGPACTVPSRKSATCDACCRTFSRSCET